VGAVACTALLGLVAGCSADTVAVQPARPTGQDAEACAALEAALPDRVAGQERRGVEPADGYAAAWGDPPIVLRCGTGPGRGFDAFSRCQVANGVDWYVPESQVQGRPLEVTMTTVGRAVNVEVVLPEDYFPPAAAMVDLAPALKRTVPVERPCL